MAFEGAPAGPFLGRDAIARRTRPAANRRGAVARSWREEDGVTVADYAWAADGVRAGRMLLSARDGLITRLVVTFEHRPLLRPLTDADVPVVERLWQLYSHDMSEVRGTLPNQEGVYKPGRLATYLVEPDDVDGYLIWHREAPAGFAFVSGVRASCGTWATSSSFAPRAVRASGTRWSRSSSPATRRLGDRVPGNNRGAPEFWRRVVSAAVGTDWRGGAATRARQAAYPGRPLHPLHARRSR